MSADAVVMLDVLVRGAVGPLNVVVDVDDSPELLDEKIKVTNLENSKTAQK